MNLTVKNTLTVRGIALNPWTGFYFLQSLLINFALGYDFSLLYAVAFSCILLLLWRSAPRVQKGLIAICSLVAAMYYPFGQAYGAPNFNTLLALHSTNFEESTEIMTIFPWYSYLVSIFILALGFIAMLGMTLNRMIDGKPQYQDNFVTLANRARFQTWWFSNQGKIGEYDTAIASIAKRADEVQFLKSGDFEADKNTRDEALLKMTAQVFATQRTTPQLIVLHLMGSHPQACGKYTDFVQSKETSCYLYNMTQTDDLLKQLCAQLKNSGNTFSMVYYLGSQSGL